MKNELFYECIDKDTENLEKEYKKMLDDKNFNDNGQRKSFVFYIWFLRNYGIDDKKILRYITDGPGDNSADLIFSLKSNEGKDEYYVLQSKWNIKKGCNENFSSSIFNGILTEFEEIKNGKLVIKGNENEKFKERYIELENHKNNNLKVKFIILTLNNIILDTKDKKRLDSFNSNKDYNELFLYDINKLKLDYIDKNYKGYKVFNPLIAPKKPLEDIEINISILDEGGNDKILKFPKPNKSYLFCVTPKEIFNLFEKYEYSIFQDNIRNPLFISKINEGIQETLKNKPSSFWYFNNGITGITQLVYSYNTENIDSKFKIKGLQIINGGQTFKQIYEYYSKLNDTDRVLLNNNVKILFKIIESSGDNEFELDVTKYTNSQNTVDPRDFYSNDLVQKRIQNDFIINTNIWYETRRGEFVKRLPSGVYNIENTLFAQVYLAYILGLPEKAKSQKDKIFISQKDKGLYEIIFNDKTNYVDLFISYSIFHYIQKRESEYRKEYNKITKKIKSNNKYKLTDNENSIFNKDFILHSSYHILMIYKKILDDKGPKYCSNIVIENYWYNDNIDELNKIYDIIINEIEKLIFNKRKDVSFTLTKYFKGSDSANDLRELFKKTGSFQKNQ